MRAAKVFLAAVLIAGLIVVALVATHRGRATTAPTVPQLQVIARGLTDEGKYHEAIGVVDQILVLDPQNDYAQGVRPLLFDKMVFARHRALQDRPLLRGGSEMRIPYERLLKYPDDWPDVTPEGPPPGERAIDAQLERKIPEINFPGIAFADAIDFLRDVSGTNIFVNWKVVEAAGISRNAPVTARLFNVRFSKGLAVILQSASTETARLAYTIDDGVVTISTQKDLDRNTLTRVYDVRDLLQLPPQSKTPNAAYPLLSSPAPGARAGAPAAGAPVAGSPPAAGSPAAVRQSAVVEELVASLQQQVDPSSWRDRGGDVGSVRELAGQLIVTQSAQNQQATAAYLDGLRHRRTAVAKVSDAACWAVPSALLLLFVALRARRYRGERRHARGRCRGCGYDLRASVGRCPECGKEIPAGPEVRVTRAGPVTFA